MSLLDAFALGAVQGLTEFLPLSSSGHLVLGQRLLGAGIPGAAFEAAAHAGTLLAVSLAFRARIAEIVRGVITGDQESVQMVLLLAIATLPVAATGLLLRHVVEPIFEQPQTVAVLLLVTGGAVWSVRRTAARSDQTTPGWRQALIIGCVQAAALLPGISRSGSTLAAGTALGVEPRRMAEFTFLLSIPAVMGALVLHIPEFVAVGGGGGLLPFVAGGSTAAATGAGAIVVFMKMIRSRVFHRWAWYCWAVGGAYLLASAIWPHLR